MGAVRAIALGLAMLIALPWCAVEGTAHAQVWKPRSRQKRKPPSGAAEAKSVATKTRKPKPARVKHVSKKKKKAVAKKKQRHVAKPAADDDDDDFTIVEEDFPDEG
jgi:hypothetical protein